MLKWAPYPFIRITMALCTGILLAHFFPFLNNQVRIALYVNFFVFVLLFFIIKRKLYYRYNFVAGITCLSVFFLLGYYLYTHKWLKEETELNKLKGKKIEFYQVELEEIQKGTGVYQKVKGMVRSFKSEGNWTAFKGKIIIHLKGDSTVTDYKPGDILLIKGTIGHVPKPENPGEFDYKKYLALQGIHLTAFASSKHIIVCYSEPLPWFKLYALLARHKTELIFNKFIRGNTEKDTLKALVLGDKSTLDEQLQRAYASAGAMHILAVSGLHVGIIFSVLQWLLRPLRKSRRTKVLTAAISISVLIFYAFLTGLSASVCRAVLMACLVIISQTLSRKSNIYNTLAVTAFLLLIYDPYLLFSVGFQLSFMAVIGIIYLQPKIYDLIAFEGDTTFRFARKEIKNSSGRFNPKALLQMNNVLKFIWSLTSVTLSAQIAVMPLALYYFHIFPIYFLLANLPLIFMAFLTLSGGFLLISTASLPVIPSFIGLMLEWVIKSTNSWILLFQNLPSASIDDIYISEFQVCLIYAALLMLMLFLRIKKFYQLCCVALILVVFSGSKFIQAYNIAKEKQVVFYSIYGGGALGLFHGKDFALFSPDGKELLPKKMDYHVKPHFIQRGILINDNRFDSSFLRKFDDFNLLVWNGKTFVILNQPIKSPLQVPFYINYLLISNNSLKEPDLLNGVDFGKIIFDNNNSDYVVKRFLTSELAETHPIHSLSLHGAFVENIN